MRRAPVLVMVFLVPVVVAGGFIGGRALRPAPEAVFGYEQSAPPYEAAAPIAALSAGGFSGFGAAGLDGQTLLAGRVLAVGAEGLTLATATGTEASVRFSGVANLAAIEPAAVSAVAQSATVALRLAEDGETVEAVLVLAP